MKVLKYYNIRQVRYLWESMDISLPPLQRYSINEKYFRIFYRNIRHVRLKPVFYVVSEGKASVIVPLVENRKEKILSEFAPLDYFDIATTADVSFIKLGLAELVKLYPGWKIAFHRVNESSRLYESLNENAVSKEVCVRLEVPDEYDDYWRMLSKHQRQNIRTAINHLRDDGISWRFKSFDSHNKISWKDWKGCLAMYRRRSDMKNGNHNGFLKKIYKQFYFPLFSIISPHSSLTKLYVLYFGNRPVAFTYGMLDGRNKSFIAPVLSYDMDYSRYSPGHILICEAVRVFSIEGIATFDLARGGEQYKYAMGGKPHYNYVLERNSANL